MLAEEFAFGREWPSEQLWIDVAWCGAVQLQIVANREIRKKGRYLKIFEPLPRVTTPSDREVSSHPVGCNIPYDVLYSSWIPRVTVVGLSVLQVLLPVASFHKYCSSRGRMNEPLFRFLFVTRLRPGVQFCGKHKLRIMVRTGKLTRQ